MRTFKDLFLVVVSILAIFILFNFLLAVDMIPHYYPKIDVEIKDSTSNNPIKNMQAAYFLVTSYRDNIFNLLLGHSSRSYYAKNFDQKLTDNLGNLTIREFSKFFKLFESFKYEVIIINTIPNNNYFTFKDSFKQYGLGEDMFIEANPNYERFIIILDCKNPAYIRSLTYDGKISSIVVDRAELVSNKIQIKLRKAK